jgi:hypothetical protein
MKASFDASVLSLRVKLVLWIVSTLKDAKMHLILLTGYAIATDAHDYQEDS